MSLRNILLSAVVLGLMWIGSPTVLNADEAIEASGSFVISGNPSCTLSQCTQIYDFSFTIIAVPDPNGNGIFNADIIESDVIGAGPLGSGGGTGALGAESIWNIPNTEYFFVPFGGDGSEADLYYSLSQTADGLVLGDPNTDGFYSCRPQTCIDAFLPPGSSGFSVCEIGACSGGATFEVLDYSTTVVQTPESSSLLYLTVASFLLLVCLARAARHNYRCGDCKRSARASVTGLE
jgi:hypothetical protein